MNGAEFLRRALAGGAPWPAPPACPSAHARSNAGSRPTRSGCCSTPRCASAARPASPPARRQRPAARLQQPGRRAVGHAARHHRAHLQRDQAWQSRRGHATQPADRRLRLHEVVLPALHRPELRVGLSGVGDDQDPATGIVEYDADAASAAATASPPAPSASPFKVRLRLAHRQDRQVQAVPPPAPRGKYAACAEVCADRRHPVRQGLRALKARRTAAWRCRKARRPSGRAAASTPPTSPPGEGPAPATCTSAKGGRRHADAQARRGLPGEQLGHRPLPERSFSSQSERPLQHTLYGGWCCRWRCSA